MSDLIIAGNNHASTENITLSSGDTTANKTALLSDDRHEYWEFSGASTESIAFDLETNGPKVSFVAIVGAFDAAFDILANTTVTLEGNDIDEWTAPELSEAMTVTDNGIFHKVASSVQNYRYWRVVFTDASTNFAVDSRYARLHNVYLGDYLSITRDVGINFAKTQADPSSIYVSNVGKQFANIRTAYANWGSLVLELIPAAERRSLEQFAFQKGSHSPFYICLDSSVSVTEDIAELSRWVYFEGVPSFGHDFRDYFSMSFSLREVV